MHQRPEPYNFALQPTGTCESPAQSARPAAKGLIGGLDRSGCEVNGG